MLPRLERLFADRERGIEYDPPTGVHVLYPLSACSGIASVLTFELLALDKLLLANASKYWSFGASALLLERDDVCFAEMSGVCAGNKQKDYETRPANEAMVAYESGEPIPKFHMASIERAALLPWVQGKQVPRRPIETGVRPNYVAQLARGLELNCPGS